MKVIIFLIMTIKCDVLLLHHATPPHPTSGKKARWKLEWSAYDQKMRPSLHR